MPDTILDVLAIRERFPALQQTINGISPVYFDNPGGTQVPDTVLSAMQDYLIKANSNTHGAFHTSHLTDSTVENARAAVADLLNASSREIVFGPNMTTLTFHISRAIGKTLKPGDQVIVTRMDHDANIAPWLLMAEDHNLQVAWVDFDVETGRLDLEQYKQLLSDKTRLVACVYASNALGTINDVREVITHAHAAGALTYIDAVQYAPHGVIDVQALDCDFLACSSYKFFGPHAGMVYGKYGLLESLPAYKVRPASDEVPDRWETGTQNHEALAGITAAVDYLAWVGQSAGSGSGRRQDIAQGMQAIKAYEKTLSYRLIEGLSSINGVHVWGITDPEALDDRVPTIIFSVEGKSPVDVASALGKAYIYVWDGNYYALEAMKRLGFERHGGLVRVGATHYNTIEEVDRFLNGVADTIKG